MPAAGASAATAAAPAMMAVAVLVAIAPAEGPIAVIDHRSRLLLVEHEDREIR